MCVAEGASSNASEFAPSDPFDKELQEKIAVSGIEIIRVLHGARDVDAVFSEDRE
jgi:hypothetical protein